MKGDELKIELGRRYRFAASHRLHSALLSAEENSRLYGKCNNPLGHGHNYVVEICVSGDVDPATGMIANLADLDGFVEREVMQRMDHRHLNYEVPELAGLIPTCENVARVIWELLEPKITQGTLHRVRLYESADLFAEVMKQRSDEVRM